MELPDSLKVRPNAETSLKYEQNRIKKILEIHSQAIPLNSYFTSFKEKVLNTFDNKLEFTSKASKIREIAVGLDMPTSFRELEKCCSIDQLKVDGECPNFTARDTSNKKGFLHSIPSDGVESLASLKYYKEKLKNNKIRHIRDAYWKASCTKPWPFDMVPLQEHVISLRVYRPFRHNVGDKIHQTNPRTQQQIEVLGRQTLDALRDVIICPNLLAKICDYSNNPFKKNIPDAKDIYESGFFYIENVFYNDTRHPENIDYSQVIRDWADKDPTSPFKSASTASMEKTHFRDVPIRFGFPYVYQHQGGCEHLIIFTNARLLSRHDDLCSDRYPLYRAPIRSPVRLCIMCCFFSAKWVTINNHRVPHDPSYFCDRCFHAFNYKEGKKICDFEAYPITGNLDFDQKALELQANKKCSESSEFMSTSFSNSYSTTNSNET